MADRILSALSAICDNVDHGPGKTVVQKLIYLAKQKGLDLGFDYTIHYYGPYCAELNRTLSVYDAEEKIRIDTENGMTHKINILETPEEASFDEQEQDILQDVLGKYAKKTALELELLTTTDYVARRMEDRGQKLLTEGVVEGVVRIKGEKFKPEQIEEAITELVDDGLIVLESA